MKECTGLGLKSHLYAIYTLCLRGKKCLESLFHYLSLTGPDGMITTVQFKIAMAYELPGKKWYTDSYNNLLLTTNHLLLLLKILMDLRIIKWNILLSFLKVNLMRIHMDNQQVTTPTQINPSIIACIDIPRSLGRML